MTFEKAFFFEMGNPYLFEHFRLKGEEVIFRLREHIFGDIEVGFRVFSYERD
jgi:hypothetical protein